MYTFGGVFEGTPSIERNTRRTSDVYRVWLKLPKLLTISWEALSYYYPNILQLSRTTLLQLGIPSKIVEELNSHTPAYG